MAWHGLLKMNATETICYTDITQSDNIIRRRHSLVFLHVRSINKVLIDQEDEPQTRYLQHQCQITSTLQCCSEHAKQHNTVFTQSTQMDWRRKINIITSTTELFRSTSRHPVKTARPST